MTLLKNFAPLSMFISFISKIKTARSAKRAETDQEYCNKVEAARKALETRLTDKKREWTRHLDC